MEWLNNGIVTAVIAFLASSTGTALIAYFAHNVIKQADKLFGDKNGEMENLKKTNKELTEQNAQ
ncbi:MAG: hypothetical protein LBQ05_00830, partial [Christensenellaceae bacterium]|nr:hypothetical protein [Christensenellaceae bacterium]